MRLSGEGLGARIPRFWRRKVLGAGLLGLREKDAESSDSLICKKRPRESHHGSKHHLEQPL